MSIVNTIARAGYEFLIINIGAAVFITGSPIVWAWYCLCIALAFLLRLGMEHRKHKLTSDVLLWQSIATITWCFFSILVWNYFYTSTTKGFEIYLFVNSLFASFMIGQFEEVFQVGFKKWLASKVGTVLATPKEEEKS